MKKDNTTICVRIPVSEREKIYEFAGKMGLTFSAALRVIIHQWAETGQK